MAIQRFHCAFDNFGMRIIVDKDEHERFHLHSEYLCRSDDVAKLEAEVARLREELRPKSAVEEHNAMLHRTGQHPLPAPPGREGEK